LGVPVARLKIGTAVLPATYTSDALPLGFGDGVAGL